MKNSSAHRALLALTFLVAGMGPSDPLQQYEFISPLPGSTANTRETTIIIREGSTIEGATIPRDAIEVFATISGDVTGDVVLSSDGRTIIFKPDRMFVAGEEVEVSVRSGIESRSGKKLPPIRFTFSIAPFAETPNPYEYIPELRPDFDDRVRVAGKARVALDSPDGFPPLEIAPFDSSDLGEGYIFLAVASEVEGVGYYLMMLNNDGTPHFARELVHDYAYDFKLQPNGMLSYAHFFEHHSYTGGGNVVHKILDESFALVDSVTAGNGYVAEAHDFQMLPNGHYLLFGYYLTPVDMSQIVEGGQPDALVSGGIVQELDAEKNVIFQWRSWDHYSFDEYPINSRFATRSIVSVFHLNTLNVDHDGHIFLATPQWVKKINRHTGEIIWNLGDFDNDFSFVGVDSTQGVGMVGGHAFHRLPNGNVLIHDNGNRQGTTTSRVNEFALDEVNKTAELIWTYVPDVLISGWHRGSAQRLPNGNTVVGWGGSSGKPSPAMTEVNAAGEVVYDLSFVPADIESYRAFRFPFTGGAPAAEVVITEVVPGNTYDFSEGSVETGISVDIVALDNVGYNEMTVTRYDFAPRSPQFVGKAPRVIPLRMVLDNFAIAGVDADVRFDIDAWTVRDPAQAIVYHREFEGSGLFTPLATTYNPVKRELVANTVKFGEFILATADPVAAVYVPIPFEPADSAGVNQTLPVTLRWTPVGYVDTYDLQISPDASFASLIVDEPALESAMYVLDSVDPGAMYYWRVRAANDVGTSEWSVRRFSTVAPFLTLTTPDGTEAWQRGLDYYIRWDDNIVEDVVLELYRNSVFVEQLATTPSDGAYQWEVGLGLEPGPGYAVKAMSSIDDALVDMSANTFMIVDTTATAVDNPEEPVGGFALYQNYPNPFNPITVIRFDIPYAATVKLSSVVDLLGRSVARLVDGTLPAGHHETAWDGKTDSGAGAASGFYFYRLETADFTETRSLVMLR